MPMASFPVHSKSGVELPGGADLELPLSVQHSAPPSANSGLKQSQRQPFNHDGPMGQLARALATWVANIILSQGGVVTSANLGSLLSSAHPQLYRVIKMQFRGLFALLSLFPDLFKAPLFFAFGDDNILLNFIDLVSSSL